MIKKFSGSGPLLYLFFLIEFAQISFVDGFCRFSGSASYQISIETQTLKKNINATHEIIKLNTTLQSQLQKGNLDKSRLIVDSICGKLKKERISDNKVLFNSYYLIGVYYSIINEYSDAIKFLSLSLALKVSMKDYDETFAKALYNLGVAYNGIGDFDKLEYYSLKSLEVEKALYGETNPALIKTYTSLVTAYIEMKEYEKSLNYAKIALSIADKNPGVVDSQTMAGLFNNLGVLYMFLADYSKAKIYLELSESIYTDNQLPKDERYINLLNSIAITYEAIGFTEKSNEYYEKGISLALSNNSALAYNNINSYAITLGNNGNKKKGVALLSYALERAKAKFGDQSRYYIEVLKNCADYYRDYNIDNNKSLQYYSECMEYVSRHEGDIFLRFPVYIGYALSLSEAGEREKALGIIQTLLFSDDKQKHVHGLFENPDIETVKADKQSLKVLQTKYKILWDIYRHSPDEKILKSASLNAEKIVGLIEKVRINISQEESRIILGDSYRDSYLNAIRDFNLLYSKTSDRQFLEKAFDYAEKSKVAGLLASTRELKAAQFHIPQNVADFERKLQRDISLFNAHIYDEVLKEKPDSLLLNKWKENLLGTTRERDSMILVFEKQYPGYYAIKYNTRVAEFDDIPKIAGRNENYITYILSDTVLYIFVANRKHQQLISLPVDSVFFNQIRQYRSLLSNPISSDNARIAYEKYKSIGYQLYKILILPVKPFLISNKLLISPDNILSYLPFETILTTPYTDDKIQYRKLPYLFNDYDISYTYSATFLAETSKRRYRYGNKAIAFAPDYPKPIDMQSVFLNRQAEKGVLHDLPYARQEAEYVSEITDGKLYENSEAKESVYKTESGKYDIIHLAMHTLLNDKDPMHSTLIFSQGNDTIDDGYLKVYEIYGVPLKAKMVVLSSCNTGSGHLYSGEGILSLARGFLYSGSESVVMSMWEIDDKSGTEIVRMFYENLKKGYSKSNALRKARSSYLKNADQFRSHPYFWSALIVYGNNNSLYHSRKLIITTIIFFTIIAIMFIYFKNRKYS